MTAQRIIEIVSEKTKVPVKDIIGKSRLREIAQARHISMYFISQYVIPLTKSEIGIFVGNRHYSTVIYTIDRIKSERKIYKTYNDLLLTIEAQIIKELELTSYVSNEKDYFETLELIEKLTNNLKKFKNELINEKKGIENEIHRA